MNTEKRDQIITRIMKLLELGSADNNTNPHERELASTKAAQLMAEYSLDFRDLRSTKPSDDDFATYFVDGSNETKKVDFEAMLAYAITAAFDCKIINTFRNGPWQIAFIGMKHDLEIAVFFYKYLRRTMYSMASKNVTAENVRPERSRTKPTPGDIKKARANYCYGLVETIGKRMQELHAKREEYIPADSKELMVVKTTQVQNYFDRMFPNKKSSRGTRMSGDINAYYQGQSDGKNVNLSRPIGNNGSATAQLS